jgi:hypothetical protein
MQPTPLNFIRPEGATNPVALDEANAADDYGTAEPDYDEVVQENEAPEEAPGIVVPEVVRRVDEAVTAFIANRDVDPETATLLVSLVASVQELASMVHVVGTQQQYMMDNVIKMFEQFSGMMSNGGMFKMLGSMLGKGGQKT